VLHYGPICPKHSAKRGPPEGPAGQGPIPNRDTRTKFMRRLSSRRDPRVFLRSTMKKLSQGCSRSNSSGQRTRRQLALSVEAISDLRANSEDVVRENQDEAAASGRRPTEHGQVLPLVSVMSPTRPSGRSNNRSRFPLFGREPAITAQVGADGSRMAISTTSASTVQSFFFGPTRFFKCAYALILIKCIRA